MCAWEWAREVCAWERVLSSQMIAIELPNHTMQQHATREPKASRVLLLLCVMPVRESRCDVCHGTWAEDDLQTCVVPLKAFPR